MLGFFREEGEIDFQNISRGVGATKSFYYDCQEGTGDFFDKIRALPGFHVRLGALRGEGGRQRQKQVDVQLATDMLTHAFHRNMEKAVLVSGDLDFKPVVDSLVSLGTHIHVCCERQSGSADLYWAADVWIEINLNTWFAWSTPAFKRTHSLPNCQLNGQKPPWNVIGTGLWNGRPVYSLQGNGYGYFVDAHLDELSLLVTHSDREVLDRYFKVVYGQPEWRG